MVKTVLQRMRQTLNPKTGRRTEHERETESYSYCLCCFITNDAYFCLCRRVQRAQIQLDIYNEGSNLQVCPELNKPHLTRFITNKAQ